MPWTHRQTQIDKRPAQVLIDDQFRSEAPISQLPRLACFGIYCRQDAGGGFWHPDETASLDDIERKLIMLCKMRGRGWAVYVMRIDTRGIREYYFYFGGKAALGQVPEVLRVMHPDYRIDYEEKTDAEWSRYKTFLPDYEPVA
jgi:hypothetical protein